MLNLMLKGFVKCLIVLTAVVFLARHPNVSVHVQRFIDAVSRHLTAILGLSSRNERSEGMQQRVSQPAAAESPTTRRTTPAPAPRSSSTVYGTRPR